LRPSVTSKALHRCAVRFRIGVLDPPEGLYTGHMHVLLLLACAVLLTAADDLDRLIDAGKPPPIFAGHKPAFSVAKESFAQAKAQGEEQRAFWVVRDGGKAIAVLDEGACQLDWIGPRLDQAVEQLVLPKTYSWARLLGCRISTVAWIDGQGPSGDTRTHAFEGGGESLTLVAKETWTKKRQGDSEYRLTIRFDPVLGYCWDARTRLSVDQLEKGKDGKAKRSVEMFNVQPGSLTSPWPDEARYDRTVISLAGSEGYLGFATNLVAGDRSDNGGKLKMREHGLTAFVADPKGWGLALVRGDTANEHGPNSTCNVWMDQHNMLLFPEQPDATGRHVIDAKWRWTGLPPQVVAELAKRTKLIDFGEKAVMVRLGVDETFDDQPLPLDTTARGLWNWGLEVNGEHARSGGKAMLVKGVEKPDGNTGRFTAPFIPLDGSARYRLEAWVWLQGGEDARFFICSGDVQAEGAMKSRSTARVAPKAEWQQISWEFTGRGNVDLRFVTLGKDAKAWVDDFSFKKLP
jgi:hypothetical protein